MKKRNTDPPGAAIAAAEGEHFSLISDETLLALYGNLLRCRMLNEHRPGMGAGAGLPGYEAASAGVTMDMVSEDSLQSTGADLLPHFLTGRPLKDLLAEARNQTNSADQLHLALGTALAHKASKDGKISVLFWSEEAPNGWQAAVEAARAHKLPIVFVSLGGLNGEPAEQKSSRKTVQGSELPAGMEMPHIWVDGADAVAVYRVAHESIERARRGRGPTLIDCRIYKVQGKRGPRPGSVASMEAYLRSKGLLKSGMKQQVTESFASELKRAKARRKVKLAAKKRGKRL